MAGGGTRRQRQEQKINLVSLRSSCASSVLKAKTLKLQTVADARIRAVVCRASALWIASPRPYLSLAEATSALGSWGWGSTPTTRADPGGGATQQTWN